MSDGVTEQARQEFETWVKTRKLSYQSNFVKEKCWQAWQAAFSRPPDLDVAAIPFDMQAVRDGYWEIFHDDDCGETLTLDGNCPKCEFHPDLQSIQARRTGKAPVRPRCPKCGGAIECLSCGPSAVKVEGTSASKPTEKVIDMEKYWAEIVQRLSAEIMARFTVRDEEAAELWAMLEHEIAPLLARIAELTRQRNDLTGRLGKPRCLDCNEVGITNCSHFDNCAGRWKYALEERVEKAEAELDEQATLLCKIANQVNQTPAIDGTCPVDDLNGIPLAIRSLQASYYDAAKARNGFFTKMQRRAEKAEAELERRDKAPAQKMCAICDYLRMKEK